MADAKISSLSSATLPLAGAEVIPLVQSGTTKKVAVEDLNPKNLRSQGTTGVMQLSGPSAGTTRVMSIPDANFTAARTDAGQTFSGVQIVSTSAANLGTVVAEGTSFGAGAWLNAFTTAGGQVLGFAGFKAYESANTTNTLYAGVHTPFGVDQAFIGTPNSVSLHFYVAGIDVGNWDTSGNFIIGTSGKGVVLPGGVTWVSGTGSPEGVVTAPVGSLFSRTDGGAGTSLYVKESGSGNTGWAGK